MSFRILSILDLIEHFGLYFNCTLFKKTIFKCMIHLVFQPNPKNIKKTFFSDFKFIIMFFNLSMVYLHYASCIKSLLNFRSWSRYALNDTV